MELQNSFEEFKKSFDLEGKRLTLKKLEARASDPALWQEPDKARALMQELGDLKREITEVEDLGEEIAILATVADEKAAAKAAARLAKMQLTTYLAGPYDGRDAILAVHAGQGGTEAMDWASILARMYLKFCERRGWQTQKIDETAGEEAGVKSVTFKVKGKYAYGYLKGEAGTHRLVRQSPFNADKKRQTSFALVEILPDFEDVALPEVEIKEEDLEWQFFRASSQGGQNVQKVSTAVRLKHKPTGMVVTAQSERFQEQNRKIALNLLKAKLWQRYQEEREKERKELKGGRTMASWGTQIRSYVLQPYKMVKDLRTGVEVTNPEAVLDGELDLFVEAEVKSGKL